MKPISLAGYDDERTRIPFTVPVKGRTKPATVKVPRFDYMPEDDFDAMMDDLEMLDVEAQVIGAANDLRDSRGEEVVWEPLLDAARTQLEGLGVQVERTMRQGQSRELLTADSKALEALKPFSDQTPLPLRKRSRSIALTMLRHVVTPQELEWFEALPTGDLNELLTQWRAISAMSLGESDASSSS